MPIVPETKPNLLRALFIGSEADPLAKVGGLGDVAGALPRSLRTLPPSDVKNHRLDVRLAIPYHTAIRQKIQNPQLVARFQVPHSSGNISGQAFFVEWEGLPIYLIDGPPFRTGEGVYSQDAGLDADRYTFFSLAAIEMLQEIDWKPDILHANDWHTALAVYFLALHRPNVDQLARMRALLTLHNLPFMGSGSQDLLAAYGLPSSQDENLPEWARLLPLPLGLASADHIVPVSPTYAQEILTEEFGCGLEDFLRSRKKVITGILNGLDEEIWNPATDSAIHTTFDINNLAGRRANKRALLTEFSLSPETDIPLIIIISRLDPQKGIDLAVNALRRLEDLPWQVIILGSGQPDIEEECRRLEKDYPTRVRAAIRFDPRLARRMYAGGDMLLMPSRYEPCGLAQMIAMRYGCLPVARATGGLLDTITDHAQAANKSTGFLFKKATDEALVQTLRRALKEYQFPSQWIARQKNAMQQDFSWKRSAKEYAEIYLKLIEGVRS